MLRRSFGALTAAGVYTDDARVVETRVRERYAVQKDTPAMSWAVRPSAVFTVDLDATWGDVPSAHLYTETRRSLGVHPSLAGCVAGCVDAASLPRNVWQVTADMLKPDRTTVVRRVRREVDRRVARSDARGAGIAVTLIVDAQLVAAWDRQPAGTFTGEVAVIAGDGTACHVGVLVCDVVADSSLTPQAAPVVPRAAHASGGVGRVRRGSGRASRCSHAVCTRGRRRSATPDNAC